jgi:hypothetical protein
MSRIGQQVILAQPGSQFKQISADQYELNPDRPEDFRQLLAALNGRLSGHDPGVGAERRPLDPVVVG